MSLVNPKIKVSRDARDHRNAAVFFNGILQLFLMPGTCNMVQNDPGNRYVGGETLVSGDHGRYARGHPGNIHNQENGGTQKAGQGCGSALPHRVQTVKQAHVPLDDGNVGSSASTIEVLEEVF